MSRQQRRVADISCAGYVYKALEAVKVFKTVTVTPP